MCPQQVIYMGDQKLKEFAKSRALRATRAYMVTCLRAIRACVLTWLRAYVL